MGAIKTSSSLIQLASGAVPFSENIINQSVKINKHSSVHVSHEKLVIRHIGLMKQKENSSCSAKREKREKYDRRYTRNVFEGTHVAIAI